MGAEVKQLVEFATQDLVAEIVDHEGLSIQSAMALLYHSEFFKQLSDPNLGLYRESGAYLFAAFKNSQASKLDARFDGYRGECAFAG